MEVSSLDGEAGAGRSSAEGGGRGLAPSGTRTAIRPPIAAMTAEDAVDQIGVRAEMQGAEEEGGSASPARSLPSGAPRDKRGWSIANFFRH